MQTRLVAIATLVALASGGTVRAQTVGAAPSTDVVVSTPVEIDADGGIAAEQRPAFRDYIVRERVPTYTIRESVVVGGTLPEDGITTYDVPQTFGATPHRYTVVNGQTVLVEPRTRRIVQVIE
jgi:hypothetical protein